MLRASLLLAACSSAPAAAPSPNPGPYACTQPDVQGRLALQDCHDPSGLIDVKTTLFVGATDTGRVDLVITDNKDHSVAHLNDIQFTGDTAALTVPPAEQDGTKTGTLAGLKIAVIKAGRYSFSVAGR